MSPENISKSDREQIRIVPVVDFCEHVFTFQMTLQYLLFPSRLNTYLEEQNEDYSKLERKIPVLLLISADDFGMIA